MGEITKRALTRKLSPVLTMAMMMTMMMMMTMTMMMTMMMTMCGMMTMTISASLKWAAPAFTLLPHALARTALTAAEMTEILRGNTNTNTNRNTHEYKHKCNCDSKYKYKCVQMKYFYEIFF